MIDPNMATQIQKIREERLNKIRKRMEEEGLSRHDDQKSDTCGSPDASKAPQGLTYSPQQNLRNKNQQEQQENDFGLSPLSSQYNKSKWDYDDDIPKNSNRGQKTYPQEKFYQRAKLLEEHKMMFE